MFFPKLLNKVCNSVAEFFDGGLLNWQKLAGDARHAKSPSGQAAKSCPLQTVSLNAIKIL